MRHTLARGHVRALAPIFLLLALAGCGGSSSNGGEPAITFLSGARVPAAVTGCYPGASTDVPEVAAVNNAGVVAGNALAGGGQGCALHGYLWDPTPGTVDVIPFASRAPLERLVAGARLAVLSTNRVSGGITFIQGSDPHAIDEQATCTDGLVPRLIPNFSYVFGVSEDGAYLTGTNGVGVPLLLDRASFKALELTIGGAVLDVAMLYKVSNTGVAVGTMRRDLAKLNVGIVCRVSSLSCERVIGGDVQGFSAFVQGISSKGDHIYGFVTDVTGATQLFSVDPVSLMVTALRPGYLIGNTSPVTDDGSLVVLDADQHAYLMVHGGAAGPALFDLRELASKLGLPRNVRTDLAQLSPNGRYVAFDQFARGPDGLFATRIEFPSGIAKWASANLTPVPPIEGAKPIIASP